MPRPSLYLVKWRRLKEMAATSGGVVSLPYRALVRRLGVSRRWMHGFLAHLSTFSTVEVVASRGRYARIEIAFLDLRKGADSLPSKCPIAIGQKRQRRGKAAKSVNWAKTNSRNRAQLGINSEALEAVQKIAVNAQLNGSPTPTFQLGKNPLSGASATQASARKIENARLAKVLAFPGNSSPTRAPGRTRVRASEETQRKNTDDPEPSLRSGAPSAREPEKLKAFGLALQAERGTVSRTEVLRLHRYRASRYKAQWAALVDGTTRRLTAAYVARKAAAIRRPKQVVAAMHEKHARVFRRAAELALELFVEDERFTVDRLLDVAWDTKGQKYAAPIPAFLCGSTMADKVREWLPPEARVEDDPNFREIRTLADMTPEERKSYRELGRRNWYSYAYLPGKDLPPEDCEDLEAFYLAEARRLYREGVIKPEEDPAMSADIRKLVMGR